SGLPTGASLSAGTHNADGSWTLTSGQLSGLTLIPAPNYSGSFTLTVDAQAYENGVVVADTVKTGSVTIDAVADKPVLSGTGSYSCQVGGGTSYVLPLDITPALPAP